MDLDWHSAILSLHTKISGSYKTTQNVRRFFQQHIGKEIHFSREFMAWMRANTGKSLGEAIEYYRKLN